MQLVALWIFRRFLEVGGIAGTALTAWNNLPPDLQNAVLALLSRNWDAITLGSIIPVAAMVWGYAWSFISTMRPQVVTSDGKQIPLSKDGTTSAKVDVIAKAAPKKRTLLDRLFNR